MKTWFKVEHDIVNDPRLAKVTEDMRLAGLGAYFLIICTLAKYDRCTLDSLRKMVNKDVSRGMFDKIMKDYGLFTIDENNCVLTCAYTPTHTGIHTSIHTPIHTPIHTDVPLDKEENRLEEKENKESEAAAFSSPEKEDRASDGAMSEIEASGAEDNPLEAMVQQLVQDRIWREALLLTHSAERAMLEKDFAWCVRYALQCSLSEGREQRLYYPYMAKKYFNAFLCQPESVNRLRNAFICHEQPMEDRLTFDRLTQYYPRIMALPEPLTKAQLDTLIERWGTDLIVFTMRQLNNYANISRYHGAMEAIESWTKKNKK